jgi:hypothetical protein
VREKVSVNKLDEVASIHYFGGLNIQNFLIHKKCCWGGVGTGISCCFKNGKYSVPSIATANRKEKNSFIHFLKNCLSTICVCGCLCVCVQV